MFQKYPKEITIITTYFNFLNALKQFKILFGQFR